MSRYIKFFPILSLVSLFLLSGVFLVSRVPPVAQGQEADSERLFIVSDEELQEHDLRLEAKAALREAIREEYPGWAEYTQQLTFGKMVVTHDLVRILLDAGYPCIEGPCPYQISVNPQVILTVMTTQYGDEPPPGFDAWQTARQIALDIKRFYERNQPHPEIWQDRFTNAGSYVMYRLFDGDERRLEEWLGHYRGLTPRALQEEEGTPTPTPTVIVPPPFLERPYATATPFPTPTPMGFGYPLNSFFDHRYPIYSSEPEEDRRNFFRFDGQSFITPTVPVDSGHCRTGKTCYTGHDGIDYGTPLGVPIRAAAAGRVVDRFDSCGLIILEHDQNGSKIYTEYMHMSEIFVDEEDDITAGQVIGEAGNVADNVHCFSGGAHLHFGVRLYFGAGTSNTNIDPFGWWGEDTDPWEEGLEGEGTDYGGYTSRWLWWGDEAGDGHYTVDDTESQAQLFYSSNWWHDENGYKDGAWWTYEVESEEESTNWAIWGTYIETPGTYVVQVYWPESGEAEATTQARYRIYSEQDGLLDEVLVDQEAGGGEWYTLGDYEFPAGPAVVMLTDWTGEPPSEMAIRMEQENDSPRVYFDAVRWATPTPTSIPTPIPTPTFTPTPSPTPTPTPTAMPTHTPEPTATPGPWGQWVAVEEAALQGQTPQERKAYSRLLSRVRDEVMAPDPKGEVYIRLVYRYAPEVTALLMENEALRREVRALAVEVRPLLENLAAERSTGAVRLPKDWVEEALNVLVAMEKQASPELQAEIAWWKKVLPGWAGKTGREIWDSLPERKALVPPAFTGTPEEVVLRGMDVAEVRRYGQLLSRVRDEVMLRTDGGKVYVALVYRYTPEVVGILWRDEGLRLEAKELLVEAEPGLESLLGEGWEEWRFSKEWVERAGRLLAGLAREAGPSLKEELDWWQKRLPGWAGKTPQEVWLGLLKENRVSR